MDELDIYTRLGYMPISGAGIWLLSVTSLLLS